MIKIEQGTNNLRKAKNIVRRRMLYAAGLGLIPIPILDATVIVGTQVLMIRDLSILYEVPFKEKRVRSLIAAMVGSLGTVGVVKAIPGIGSLLGAGITSVTGAAATYAIGKVFIQHYESGGTLFNLDPVKARAYYQNLIAEGEAKAKELLRAAKEEKDSKIISVEVPNKTFTTKYGKKVQAEEIRKKLIKALVARRQKVVRRNRILIGIGSVFLIFLIYQFWSSFQVNPYAAFSELDLLMREKQAKVVNLQPFARVTLEDVEILESFTSNSTEGVLWEHIKKADGAYPRRFSLSAIRFINNSEALNSGGEQQLKNLAFIMKLFPEIEVHIYGHTSKRGAEFERQRIGRARARILKDIFLQEGISGYRITENFIEKDASVYNEYWGSEIVIEVTSAESGVIVARPSNGEEVAEEQEDTPRQRPRPRRQSNNESIPPREEENQTSTPITPLAPDTDLNRSVPILRAGRVSLSGEMTGIQTYLRAPVSSFPKKFMLSDVVFIGESLFINTSAEKQIRQLAQLMKDFPRMQISIYPHVPGQSATQMKRKEKASFVLRWQQIGESRAREIRRILVAEGIARSRINTRYQFELKTPEDNTYWATEIAIENRQ